eukprot:4831734-Pyramimonas_sp.AAC.1
MAPSGEVDIHGDFGSPPFDEARRRSRKRMRRPRAIMIRRGNARNGTVAIHCGCRLRVASTRGAFELPSENASSGTQSRGQRTATRS